MKLKLESFRKAHQPVRLVKKLDHVALNFKPTANHKYLVMNYSTSFTKTAIFSRIFGAILSLISSPYHLQKEFEEKKKAEGKRSRDDKNAVLDMLFKAFDKHQYYTMKDLVLITKQPVVSEIILNWE